MELTTKSVCVPLSVCEIVMHTCQCIRQSQHSFMPSGVLMRHLRQCIHQRSAFPCLLQCSFVHLHQCMLWASIGKPVQSAVFCCPQAHGSLVFVAVPFSFWVVPPPNLPCFNCIIITLSAWRVPFFPFAWGLMAGSPGFASHGSSLI